MDRPPKSSTSQNLLEPQSHLVLAIPFENQLLFFNKEQNLLHFPTGIELSALEREAYIAISRSNFNTSHTFMEDLVSKQAFRSWHPDSALVSKHELSP
jgi:hypothetical protein